MEWFPEAAAGAALYGLLAGQLVPTLIERIPEPQPEPSEGPTASTDQRENDLDATAVEAPPPAKELYADIGRRHGLRWKTALATAVTCGLLGAAVGWEPEFFVLLYLAPVGVALAVVDWRTQLLPTKVIAPSYFVVIALVLASGWLQDDLNSVIGAGWGWLVAGGTFLLLWLVYPRGMGLGDVRLSGVLGLALGHLGWGELLVGVWSGFFIGAVGGGLLAMLRIVDRRRYPFGPFMLVGAVAGVLLGPGVAEWYAAGLR